jgi:hypothetical protein
VLWLGNIHFSEKHDASFIESQEGPFQYLTI